MDFTSLASFALNDCNSDDDSSVGTHSEGEINKSGHNAMPHLNQWPQDPNMSQQSDDKEGHLSLTTVGLVGLVRKLQVQQLTEISDFAFRKMRQNAAIDSTKLDSDGRYAINTESNREQQNVASEFMRNSKQKKSDDEASCSDNDNSNDESDQESTSLLFVDKRNDYSRPIASSKPEPEKSLPRKRQRIQNSCASEDASGMNYRQRLWKTRYQELIEFKNKHGHTCVPSTYHENKSLANWVVLQRQEFRRRKLGVSQNLTQDRVIALNKLGFVWTLSKNPKIVASWDDQYEALKRYKSRFGNTLVPQRWKEDYHLGRWVETQRRQYKLRQEGKTNNLTEERFAKLDTLGFAWTLRDRYDEAFDRRFNKLKQFVAITNRLPQNKDDQQMVDWISECKMQYKKWVDKQRTSSMTPQRRDALMSLGVKFTDYDTPKALEPNGDDCPLQNT